MNVGAAVKVPCRVATTANISLSAEQTIDGVAVVTGDRVLVKNQTTGTENGIYVADTGTWVLDVDFDGAFDVLQGTFVYVINGSTNANTVWRVTTSDPVIGTSSIAFTVALFSDLSTATFQQAGSGAVIRAAQSKMREVVTPADFGAVGDLATDDTTALAAAITTGKHVDLAGLGYLTQGLTLATAGQKIFNGKLNLKNATDQSVITVTADRCKVLDVEIDGNKANQTTVVDSLGSGVWLADGIDSLEVRGGYIHDCKRNGVAGFGNSDSCVVFGNRIIDCAYVGVYPSQASNRPNKRWQISANEISGFGQDGIGTVAIQYGTISGNRILHPSDGVAVACVALEAECNNTAVFGNSFEGTSSVGTSTANGVQVNDSRTVSVTGNTFDGLGQAIDLHGAIAGSYNVSVIGNTIVDCGYTGNAILVAPTTPGDYGASIIGNTIRDCPFGAIQLNGAQHCIVNGNHINGVNLQNTASKRFVSGIVMTGQAYYNTIIGNVILEGTSGNMKIGIHEHAAAAGFDSGVNTIRDNRIVGADFDIICGGTAYSFTTYSKVTRVLDTAATAVPTTGHWEQGDAQRNEQPSIGNALEWVCDSSGTFGATATTGSITNGSFQLTLASAVGLYAGMKIKVVGAGAAAADLTTYINGFDGTGTTCSLKDSAGTSVVGNAVTLVPPTFVSLTLS